MCTNNCCIIVIHFSPPQQHDDCCAVASVMVLFYVLSQPPTSISSLLPPPPAGRTTRIIDPDGDKGARYESSNIMPDLTSRMHEAKSSPEANRQLMLRIRRSNVRLGDGRIKVRIYLVPVGNFIVTPFSLLFNPRHGKISYPFIGGGW